MAYVSLEVTPGSGTKILLDTVGIEALQVIKFALGGEGVKTLLSAGPQLMSASLPVTIATDQGDLKMTMDGETVPISADALPLPSGAATSALQGGGLPAALGAGGGLKVDGSGTELPVSIATVPSHDVTNAGTFATQVDGAALTALQLIDDAVHAEDAAHSTGEKGVMALGVRQDSIAALGADGDYIPPTMDANGQTRVLAGSPDFVVSVTPTLDTNAYAAGDLLFDSTAIAAAVRVNGGTAILQSITMLDKADQGVGMTLLFANAETDFGALNGAPDPDDTEAGTVIGHIGVLSGDYVDLGASKVACIRNIGLMLKAGAATTSLYIAAINGTGTPTYANGDLVLQLGFMRS